MIKLRLLLSVIVASLVLGMLIPLPASALVEPSATTIDRAGVFQNVFEEGDWLFVIKYDIEYAESQEYPISELFTFHVSTPGGVTIVSNNLSDNHFNENLTSIYLTREQAISYGFGTASDPWSTWGSGYLLELKGSTTYFIDGTPPYDDYTLNSSHYFPGAAASYPQDYDDWEDANSVTIGMLDNWIMFRLAEMEDESGEELIVEYGGRTLANSVASIYVADAIPGYPEFSRVLNLSQYVPGYTKKEFTYTYSDQLHGTTKINQCEKTNDWSATGAIIDTNNINYLQGRRSLEFVYEAPTAFTSYCITYNPDDVMNVGERTLNFEYYNTRANSDFVNSTVFIYDDLARWYSWDMTFQSEIWGSVSKDLQLPDNSSSGTISLSSIDSIVWCVQTTDTEDYTILIDNVRATGIPSVGEVTKDAFDGLGDYFGVSGTFIGSMFFMFAYMVMASVVFLATSNSIAAMVIAIPLILFAALIGIVPLVTVAVVTFVIVFVAAAYWTLK